MLILGAFSIVLLTSAFLDKKSRLRMLLLVAFVFAFSIIVFVEFYITPTEENALLRKILMCIRYSATPFLIALVSLALVKQLKSLILIPAGILLILNIISIFTGIVFGLKDNINLVRGPLGLLPFIVPALYMAFLIYLLIIRSNKRAMEIVPIVFLAIALTSGVVFPFIFGHDFSKIFCSIIAAALFIYHVFSILQMTKKDPLTGLLNRQAYYAEVDNDSKDVSAVVSIDMNGLKETNDTQGHAAGDEALMTLGLCFLKACKGYQSAYRVGGDEFLIVCRRGSLDSVEQLVKRIDKYVGETKYTCAVGFSFNEDGKKTAEQLVKESDEAMYLIKDTYYKNRK